MGGKYMFSLIAKQLEFVHQERVSADVHPLFLYQMTHNIVHQKMSQFDPSEVGNLMRQGLHNSRFGCVQFEDRESQALCSKIDDPQNLCVIDIFFGAIEILRSDTGTCVHKSVFTDSCKTETFCQRMPIRVQLPFEDCTDYFDGFEGVQKITKHCVCLKNPSEKESEQHFQIKLFPKSRVLGLNEYISINSFFEDQIVVFDVFLKGWVFVLLPQERDDIDEAGSVRFFVEVDVAVLDEKTVLDDELFHIVNNPDPTAAEVKTDYRLLFLVLF